MFAYEINVFVFVSERQNICLYFFLIAYDLNVVLLYNRIVELNFNYKKEECLECQVSIQTVYLFEKAQPK